MFTLEYFIIIIPVILISITIHEFSHAKAADILGDPTPRLAGRLTLNPINHIDPIGFLALIFVRFGWAKPVPINPYNFRDPRRDSAIVGLAGPVSNFFLAWILAGIMKVLPFGTSEISLMAIQVFQYAVWINIALAVFNLIPIPPLDGSHILEAFLPYEFSDALFVLRQYGFLILIFIILFPPTQTLLIFIISSLYKLLL